MQLDIDALIKVAGPIVGGLATKIVGDLIERRPRLVCFFQHSSAVSLKLEPKESGSGGATIRVHTHCLVVANQGREPAQNVRLGHIVLPDFEIYPDINYQTVTLPGGSKEIVIPLLSPKEQVSVNYIYLPPLTYREVNTHVKSDAGPARVLNVLPTPQLPRWATYLVWVLMACGVAAIFYTLIALAK